MELQRAQNVMKCEAHATIVNFKALMIAVDKTALMP